MIKNIIFASILVYGATFFSACSHHSNLQSFNKYYYDGHDKTAYEYAKSKIGDGDVLWNLQAGISGFALAQKDTFALLEQGEVIFNKYEEEGLMGGIFANMGAVLINENVKSYRGNIYEGVMLNYYKALEAMSSGDYAKARVEFNRANDRQRRAKDYFNKDIQKALQEQSKQNAQDSTLRQIDSSRQSQSVSLTLEREYSNLKNFKAYSGFINPAVSYVSALFFMSEGDYTKAMDLYKESYGITKSQVINQDLKVIQERKNGNKTKYTWFIIEDGNSAYKYDASINLPSFYVSGSVLHVGISVPALKLGKASASIYKAQSIGGDSFVAYEVSDIDSVIANEFQKQLPLVITRAITSAIIKSSTQAVLSNQLGDIGALAGMLYSATTTSSDVRISTALPKRILAIQIPNNVDKFALKADDTTLYDVYFECENENLLEKNETNKKDVIILCEKYDNIVYFRTKGKKHPLYRILKGDESE